MKSLVIHRSSSRLNPASALLHLLSREPSLNPPVSACENMFRPNSMNLKHLRVLIFVLMERKFTWRSIKLILLFAVKKSALVRRSAFNLMVHRRISGARQFWLIALTAGSENEFPYQSWTRFSLVEDFSFCRGFLRCWGKLKCNLSIMMRH